MVLRPLALLLSVLLLAGCASLREPPASGGPWHDDAFGWRDPAAVTGRDELFRLDPDLAARLRDARYQALPPAQRLDELLNLIFGADRKQFRYASRSTVAAQTWRDKRGDCLSLTVLAYAAARASGLPATMQEVPIAPTYDRRDGFDYVGRHVNLLVRLPGGTPSENPLRVREVIVDFEPKPGSVRRGQPLSDDAVLARFHSNRGVEEMAAGRQANAYAHLRAAVATDPTLGASYTNLAVLYRQARLDDSAEQLLRRALQAGHADVPALRALHELLAARGRDAEAREVAERLQAMRASDPYFWIAEGVRWLEDGQPVRAVAALERAQDMASGFGEIHRLLAVAYWRMGQATRAQEQLTLLARLDQRDPALGKLRRKFDAAPH
jgi:tetratricopeptide (TPR) repeat protein